MGVVGGGVHITVNLFHFNKLCACGKKENECFWGHFRAPTNSL